MAIVEQSPPFGFAGLGLQLTVCARVCAGTASPFHLHLTVFKRDTRAKGTGLFEWEIIARLR